MDEKECVKDEKTNKRIEQELRNVSRTLDSLEDVIIEIDSGDVSQPDAKDQESLTRSISGLIKEMPKMLEEIAENVRSKTSRLRDLVL